jgi:thioredoxin 2
MSDPAGLIVICPACATQNRVPAAKLAAAPKCGRCGKALFLRQPLVLTAANFDAHTVKSDLPLLVDFWAAWCGPCRQMAPAFAAAAAQLEPAVRLGKLDTEAEPTIAGRYAIRSIPTLVLVQKVRQLARHSGAMPASAIVAWAKQGLSGR